MCFFFIKVTSFNIYSDYFCPGNGPIIIHFELPSFCCCSLSSVLSLSEFFFSFPPQQPHTKKTHSVCTHSFCLIMLFIIFHFSFKKAISTLISPVKSHCDSYATLKWCALSFSLSFLSLCIFQELPAPKRKIRAGTRSEEGTRKATRRRPSTCSVRRDRTVSDTETTTFFYQIRFWEQNKS